ncbi:stalk domain-containing protein [Paenibacillus piscarius]|uniref:stalk domain-containing protein n=1 Tax=Paenibacillus piscarius TaxID=1089681 RepID=UPI001EE804F8|nr:stalk domain-containing protein [Paenibacillus piscarius]
MGNSKAGKRFMMTAVLVLSLAVSGIAGAAAGIKTMKKDGMELMNLRQAAMMYGYSIEWNSKDRSVSLMYMDKMMDDGKMMDDDKMMDDSKTMDDGMMPAAKMIKVMIGSKKMMVDGKTVNLSTAPALYDGSTYVADTVVTMYMKPAKAMK